MNDSWTRQWKNHTKISIFKIKFIDVNNSNGAFKEDSFYWSNNVFIPIQLPSGLGKPRVGNFFDNYMRQILQCLRTGSTKWLSARFSHFHILKGRTMDHSRGAVWYIWGFSTVKEHHREEVSHLLTVRCKSNVLNTWRITSLPPGIKVSNPFLYRVTYLTLCARPHKRSDVSTKLFFFSHE